MLGNLEGYVVIKSLKIWQFPEGFYQPDPTDFCWEISGLFPSIHVCYLGTPAAGKAHPEDFRMMLKGDQGEG